MTTPKTENRLAALKKEYQDKYKAELDNVAKDIEALLDSVCEILDSVEANDRPKVLEGTKIRRAARALGIVLGEPLPEATERVSRAELSEEAVKALIGGGTKTKSELSAHFKGGNKKVVAFLDELVKANKLQVTITKSKKGKDLFNYKVK